MKYTLVGDLPKHLYCFVDSTYCYKQPCGFVPCVWFGIVSYPGRTWGCNVMLECGAVYRNIPVHAIGFSSNPVQPWAADEGQTWDCYGEDFSVIEYRYISGLRCIAKAGKGKYPGRYLFTAAPIGDGFSAVPEQNKEFSFIQLDVGRLTVQPTDRVVFEDKSFTGPIAEFPTSLACQTYVYHAE